jgi:uncharacterized protein with HEPN domain
MIAAADAIAGYVARGRSVFDADSAVREAIVYQIVVIGEAAKAVTAADTTVATDIPEVEWSLLARMRDKITHQYWAVDREIVWSTAAVDIPEIRKALAKATSERCGARVRPN